MSNSIKASTSSTMNALNLNKVQIRNNLLEQISILNSKLVNLDSAEEVKKLRKLSATRKIRKQSLVGPLPKSLASAPKRHIALLFSYEGWAHSGLAYQPPTLNSVKTLPTVEGCLLEALEQSRLIEPMVSLEGFGCGFERCGRTDAGVSSSAQVVNLWVRSALPDPMGLFKVESLDVEEAILKKTVPKDDVKESTPRPPSSIEIPYVAVLNRQLPSSIRILAWSPVTSSFSSRYSCIWRHYKYFFSISPSAPFSQPNFDFGAAYYILNKMEEDSSKNFNQIDWTSVTLNVDLMRDGLARLVGDHDYRNFCKVDAAKQLTTHQRRVISASIDKLDGEGEDMYVLNLRGGAFLYNQVRHIVALLFLIGAKHETPDIIDRLLWTSDRTTMTEDMSSLPPDSKLMDRKPSYAMAEDLPLILWQCGYNSSELNWRIDNTPLVTELPPIPLSSSIPISTSPIVPVESTETFRRQFLEMNKNWTESRLKSIILRHHLSTFSTFAPPSSHSNATSKKTTTTHGAGRYSTAQSYIPLLHRPMGELPEITNKKWAEGKGALKMLKREEVREISDATRAINLSKKAEAKRRQEEEACRV